MDELKAFPLLMKQEGISIVNVVGDKGGLTKFGIAQKFHPDIDVASLTEAQAEVIYQKEYWDPAHCSYLKPELQYAHFSASVNCGVIAAIKILQRAAKVQDDGMCGPATLGAAKSISLADYCIEWNKHYQAIVESDESERKFLIGWQNRINIIMGWFKQGLLA